MASIEIGPLGDRLNEEEIVQLASALEKLGAPTLPHAEEDLSLTVDKGLDDDVLTEFFDRLDAHDVAAEIYLPMEFEGRVDVAHYRVASLAALIEALDEVKDELAVSTDDDDEEEEEDDTPLEEGTVEFLGEQLRLCWAVFYEAAQTAYDKRLPLHISV